jgi:hypothetical protein
MAEEKFSKPEGRLYRFLSNPFMIGSLGFTSGLGLAPLSTVQTETDHGFFLRYEDNILSQDFRTGNLPPEKSRTHYSIQTSSGEYFLVTDTQGMPTFSQKSLTQKATIYQKDLDNDGTLETIIDIFQDDVTHTLSGHEKYSYLLQVSEEGSPSLREYDVIPAKIELK